MTLFQYSGPGITITHFLDTHPQPAQFTMHTHTYAEVYFFLSGRGIFHIEGSTYPLSPGDILLMRPVEAHYIELDTTVPYERIVINFDPLLISQLDPEGSMLIPFYERKAGKRNLYRQGSDFEKRWEFLREMVNFNGNRATYLAYLILLLHSISHDYRNTPPQTAEQDTIEYRIIRYINKNLHEELTLQTLCDRFFISRAQLCRRFHKATGTSVGRYIGVKRLLAANQMISQGQKPTDVFSLCGYRDYSTFYRAYITYFGHSPKDLKTPVFDETGEVARHNIK